MSLIDLGRVTGRSYGGLGFSIDGLPIEISVAQAATSITLCTDAQLDVQAIEECEGSIARARESWGIDGLEVTVKSVPPQHVGLGTKTALLLALLKSMSYHSGVRCNVATLQRISGRGGASGIGVHAFFRGGFMADGGHQRIDGPLAPSSARQPLGIPPLTARHPFPRSWVVQLCLPTGSRVSGDREREFFTKHTPIEREGVYSTLGLVYHKLIPAVVQRDFEAFRQGTTSLQSVGFKRSEVLAQPQHVRRLIDDLAKNSNIAAGMSSLGPLVYVITRRRDERARMHTQSLCNQHGVQLLGTFAGRNSGFEILPQ